MPRRRPHPYPPGPEPEGSRLQSPLPRLAWRYRSELAPLTLALVLLATGVVLHWRWPAWWQVVAAVAVAAGLVVGDLGHRLGLDRPTERAYAAMVSTAGGLWLAAATPPRPPPPPPAAGPARWDAGDWGAVVDPPAPPRQGPRHPGHGDLG
jgi:hypothetical protein